MLLSSSVLLFIALSLVHSTLQVLLNLQCLAGLVISCWPGARQEI